MGPVKLMTYSIELKVLQASKDDVYFDTARISAAHRGGIEEGVFCEIRHGKHKAYVALRGRKPTDKTIQIDEKTRDKLHVEENNSYLFEIRKLRADEFYKPLWHTSNPFTRTISQISLIGFALGIFSSLPVLQDIICRAIKFIYSFCL
jgi:hypothetical protein